MPNKKTSGSSTKKTTTNKKSKRPQKSLKSAVIDKIPNVYNISKKSLGLIYENRRPFAILLVIYYLLTVLFVRGLATSLNLIQFKSNYLVTTRGGTNVGSDFSGLGHVISSSFSGVSGYGGLIQSMLFVVFSLIFIWTLREILKGNKVTARDGLYNSQTPLIQFVLILALLFLEFIPILVGIFLYTIIFGDGIAANSIEKTGWYIIIFLLVVATFYLLISTLFALYIVTIPGVRPIQALRSSWNLVKNRRLIIFRKVLFLFVALLIIVGSLSILSIAVVPKVADFIYYGLMIIAVLIAHSYLYHLYRDLL